MKVKEKEKEKNDRSRGLCCPYGVRAYEPRLRQLYGPRALVRGLHGIDFFLETLEFDLTRSTGTAGDPEVATRLRGPRDARLS